MAHDGRGFAGKLADPDFRRARAGRARAKQDSPSYLIDRLVSAAPRLTAEDADKLRRLLPPVPDDDSGQAA